MANRLEPLSPPSRNSGDLYRELWNACAGPLVDMPKEGERVYYFPQGHVELLEASTDQDLSQICVPLFDLPSKILCRVINIQVKAEKETDEVYAQITLLPEPSQDEPTTPDPCPVDPPRLPVHSFCHVVTASNTRTQGGFLVLPKHATDCLPRLDMNQSTPTQELVTKDIHGCGWQFKHTFRGKPRRHLLEAGWSVFVAAKRLVSGDTFVFLSMSHVSMGENGELYVGVRRLTYQQCSMQISTQSMVIGVLGAASHALATGTMFVVYYWPRRTGQFIISLNKYLEAVNNKFTVGMRYMMRFEGKGSSERRFLGTVVATEDFSPHWKDSRWRSLKVQWDDPVCITRPDVVSPWEIEPFISSAAEERESNNQIDGITSILILAAAATLCLGISLIGSGLLLPMSVFPSNCFRVLRTTTRASPHGLLTQTIRLRAQRSQRITQCLNELKQRKTELATGCRSFAIELIDHSTVSASSEKGSN